MAREKKSGRKPANANPLNEDHNALPPTPYAPVGGDALVNSLAAGSHGQPSVTFLAGGRYVIASQRADGATGDVWGRLFHGDGTPIGDDFEIKAAEGSEQNMPQVAALADGGFVVVWEDNEAGTLDIRARIFEADGASSGELAIAIAGDTTNEMTPAVAGLAGGGFVVAWVDVTDPQVDVRARIFLADGSPAGLAFTASESPSGDQANVAVAVLADGTILMVWDDSGTTDVHMRRFDANGAPVTGELTVNGTADGSQGQPCVAGLAGGGYAIAWIDAGADGDGGGIYVRTVAANGDPLGADVRVNTLTAGYQLAPAIAALPDGGFMVSWMDDTPPGADDIRAQRFDAGGAPVGGEFVVNAETDGYQATPALAADAGSGTLVVVWATSEPIGGDSDGAIAQRLFTPGGVPPPPPSASPGVDLNGAGPGIDFAGSFTEGEAGAAIGADIAVTAGALPLTGATITITDAAAGDGLVVDGTLPPTITVLSGAGTAALVLAGTGTAAQWAAALALVRYANAGDNPDAFGADPARTISVVVSDGVNTSTAAVATLAIVAVNDAPQLANLSGDAVTWTEGDALVLLDAGGNAALSDVDSANFAGGSLSFGILMGAMAHDLIFVHSTGAVSVSGSDVIVGGTTIGTIGSQGGGLPLTIDLNADATPARVQQLIAAIAYTNLGGDAPNASPRSIAYILNDGDGGATGGGVTVTVVAVNDVPVVTTTPGTTVYLESVNTAPGSVAVDDALTVADADHIALFGAQVSITGNFQLGQDILAFTNNDAAAFGNISAFYSGSTGVLTLTSPGSSATLAQWQAALRAVTYSNSAQEPSQATRTISFMVYDGEDESALATRLLSVTAQNDSPSGGNGTATINEDTAFTFTTGRFGFTDVDGDSFAGVRFGAAPVGGSIHYDGVAVTSFPTTTYSAADISAGRLTFVPTANLNGTAAASVSFTVVDNGGTTGAGQNADTTPNTLSFNIVSINDQPSGADKTITINEDAAYTLTVADFGFSDVDGNAFEAVIFSQIVTGGTLYINGNPMMSATLVYLHTIQSGGVVFVPAANATGAVGSVRFTVRDNGGFDNGGQAADTTPNFLTFSMTAVNDAPVNGVPGAQAVDEDASLVFSTANGNALSVADVDATALTVTLSVAHGTLTLASTAGLTFSDGAGDATMTFTGTAAAINAALGAGLTYAPAGDYNDGDTLSIATSDNGGSGAGGTRTDADTVAITVNPLADPPVIANFDADVTFVEGSAAIRIDMAGDALVTDVDSMDFAGGYLQVILQEAVPSEDAIGFATSPDTGITLSDGTNTGSIVSIGGIAIGTIVSGSPTAHGFTVNFNANADAADATTLLRAITYLNTNTDHPSTLTRAIVVFVNDGDDGGQAGAVSNVHITRVNDAPTNAVPGGQTINEDSSLTLSTANGNAIGVADVDATTLTVTLSVAHGTLTLASTAGLGFSGGSDGAADATMTFSGTAAAINAALGSGLTYVPTADFNGGDSISVVTTDGGQTGTGPVGTDSDSVAIAITAINDAPSGADTHVALNEDVGRVLTAADFGYSDTADGDAFAGVVLTSLPAAGFLIYDPDGAGGLPGAFANVGRFITAAELALGALIYYPASHAHGAASASFTFQVRDGGGSANGGQDTDQSPNTIIFDINPVNDAPSGTSATIAISEDAPRILTQADFGFSDPVEGNGFDGVVIATLPGNGTLLLNGAAVAVAGTFVSAAQIGAGQLVFAPGLNANGTGYASFDFQVRDDGGTADGGFDTDQSPNSLTFDVAAVNDAPTLDLNGAGPGLNNNVAYVENADATLLAPAAMLGDVDSANFDGGSVRADVIVNLQPSDFLQIVDQGDGAGQIGVSDGSVSHEGVQIGTLIQGGSPATLIVTLNANATVAAVAALVRALSYFAPTELPAGGTRGIVVSVADGDGGTVSRNVNVAVTPMNDAPSGADNLVTGSEDDPYFFTAADFGFTDPGEGHALLAVRIATLPLAGDLLLNGVAVTAGDVVAISAIDAGMLTFRPDPDGFSSPYASFTFQVQDDGGTANGGQDLDQTPNTITINVIPDNLAPVLDLDAGAAGIDTTLTYTENDPAAAIAPDAMLTDDSPDFAGGTITARFTANGAAEDQLSLRSGGGIGVSPTDDTLFYGGALIGSWGGGAGGADLVVQLNANATAAAVEAVLRAIAYANLSDDPAVPARTIAIAVSDGDGGAASAQVTIDLIPVDDAAQAHNDMFTIDEAALLSGNVFLDHGAGADADVDGPGLAIAAVNGASAHVGQQILLASGALLTLNADGSFAYATNHAFDATPTGASGASNMPAFDSFTYTLAGGGTATVTLTIAGLDSDDILLGTAGNDVLLAGIGNDELNGGAGADVLYGQGGADIARGGTGDDVYIIDSMGDATEEAAGAGNDMIVTSLSYILSSLQEIETLTTQTHAGTDDVFLTGNQYNNTLIGNAGDNLLNGVDGADVLIGLAGDDTYVIDNLGDLVIDTEGQGNDIVFTYLSHTLTNGNQIETLSTVSHQGTDAINLGGSDYDNTLIGNYGANYLNGNGGADVMIGLNGNDTYVVDNAGDQVLESAGGGTDTALSFVSYTLGAGQEVETLSTAVHGGTAAINLTGNELAQTIIGNAGANLIDGKSGNDTLYGLGGADTFAFTSALGAGNVDTIADFAAGSDRIGLDDAIFTAIGATLNANAFVIGTAAGDADDRIIYNSATGALFYDADGSGAGAAIQFATLSGAPALTASDFTLI